jgi:hypothetical protein
MWEQQLGLRYSDDLARGNQLLAVKPIFHRKGRKGEKALNYFTR